MDANTRRQSRLDIERLRMAAERLETLSYGYALALGDLRIARQGLNTIAKWANDLSKSDFDIRCRALDTLSLMHHKE